VAILGEIRHKKLGRVVIQSRANSHRATARWRNGMVALNIPRPLALAEINRILDEFTPSLLAVRPKLLYETPMTLTFPGVEFKLSRQGFVPGKILGKAALPQSTLEIANDIDLQDEAAVRAVSNMLCRLAQKIAPDILLPHARELADRIGRHPAGWRISSGFRVLGTCSSKGIISLSYALVFLPQELRDLIILHELAHLSEMNHSPRFHALLDTYLDGREALLRNLLRNYAWPILRK
jgi:predicted metal-dependent hydrolase